MALSLFAFSFGEDVFAPTVSYTDGIVTVEFLMADPAMHIYDDMLACSLGAPLTTPSKDHVDVDGRVVYEGLATFTYAATTGKVFTLSYQGCDAEMCHMPQDKTFTILLDGSVVEGEQPLPETVTTPEVETPEIAPVEVVAPVVAEVAPEAPAVEVPAEDLHFPAASRFAAGYYNTEDFMAFLKGETDVSFASNPLQYVKEHGIWVMLLLIFVGGFALNLTPCVLPMIPINLAIIGAGAAGGSRMQGAMRGGAYGLGIALAYGSLGLIAALTGAAFGTIQSTWWFNLSIAVIFIALALALFDVFMIDFTRFSQGGNGKQGTIAAFVAGVMSAILAGACVAPVLIAVLLLTSSYFTAGYTSALFLPFILGLGMALPWPFAGAGLSFLPKPGAWMAWVKKIFGAVVILFALYYGYTAWKILAPASETEVATDAHAFDAAAPEALAKAIATALEANQTVVIDVWGPACKACKEMEETTFQAPEVKAQLESMAFFKVRMDLADMQGVARFREAYKVSGLPTYLVIEPQGK
jgi:thiol:disulfide interchange protein